MRESKLEKEIWILDDDKDDHELLRDIFTEANWPFPLQLFTSGAQLLERLAEQPSAPFIIISDINLPGMDGLELRDQLLKKRNKKFHSVPFIFWSTEASEAQVSKAFELKAHGFFIKELRLEDWKKSLARIIDYWMHSKIPSKKDNPEP